MSDIVSEIKSRLNVEDVVGQYVQLKRAGSNLKGLCPFHNEKTPSFMVSPDKGIAYCFGCHKGGDIIKFIEEVEGVDFKEAIKILADKAGIDMSAYQLSSETKQSKSEKDNIYEIHEVTAKFFSEYLWNSAEGKKILDYLYSRGLKEETIKHFKVGLSPDSFDQTHMHLVKKGFSRRDIVSGGIAVSKDTQADKVYDRFRGRLMFPVWNGLGRIVAFGGRALKEDEKAKYLNSPDSPIYKKSEILYGYNFAKEAVKKSDAILLVEGYFDVIMSYQAGATNVAATSGTALSIEQIKLIKRITKNCIFCFDTDTAGIEAAKRGFELAQHEEMNVSVVKVPEEKDPADYIKQNGEKWLSVIDGRKPFMDFVIKEVVLRTDLNSIEGKKKFLDELIHYLHMIGNSIEKDFYIREISREIDVKEVKIYDEMKKKRGHAGFRKTDNDSNPKKDTKKFSLFEIVSGLVYEHPEYLEVYFDRIDENYLDEEEKSIYKTFKDNYNLLRTRDEKKDFLLCFNEKLRSRLEIIALFVDDKYGTFNEQMLKAECELLLQKAQNDYLNIEKRELFRQIREAESTGNKNEAKRLLEQFNNLVTK